MSEPDISSQSTSIIRISYSGQENKADERSVLINPGDGCEN